MYVNSPSKIITKSTFQTNLDEELSVCTPQQMTGPYGARHGTVRSTLAANGTVGRRGKQELRQTGAAPWNSGDQTFSHRQGLLG